MVSNRRAVATKENDPPNGSNCDPTALVSWFAATDNDFPLNDDPSMLRRFIIICCLQLLVGPVAASASADEWFTQAAVSHLILTADGTQAAWLDLRDDAVSVRRGSIDELPRGEELALLPKQLGLGLYRFASYLVVHSTNARGSQQLTLIDGVDGSTLSKFSLPPPASFSILGLKRSDSAILVAHDARQNGAPDIFLLRPGRARLELVEQNPGRIFSWLADVNGEVLLARRWRPAGNGIAYRLLYRQRTGGPWRQIAEHDLKQAPIVPLGFTPDGGSVYVTKEGSSGGSELRKLETLSGRLGPPLLEIPDAGIESLMHDPVTGALALVGYEQALPGVKVMSETWRTSIRLLDQRLPGSRYNFLGQRAQAESLWFAYGAAQPGAFFMLRKNELSLQQLGWSYPNLAGRKLVPVKPFQFEARDGLHLNGYLTIPRSPTPLPAIMLVHGGPWARDHWIYNPEVQYLAALGYAVIQVNFRGSRGLGNALLQAGRKQWGRAMQTDLVAAVAEASLRGLIDPKRVCIMGSSYGGYAALMGVIEYPEVFRCAIARSAVTDLYHQIKTLQRSGNQRAYLEWSVMVGDLGGSRKKLNSISPLHRWSEVERPVLLAHGLLDSAVKFSPAQQLATRLAANQAEFQWLPLSDEGHGLSNRRNRKVYYSAVANFLSRNLK